MKEHIHPGVVLKQKFMDPLNLSSSKLAKFLRVYPGTINDIVLERKSISSEMALKLAHYFKTPISYWMNLYLDYEAKKTINELDSVKEEKHKELLKLKQTMKKELADLPTIPDFSIAFGGLG